MARKWTKHFHKHQKMALSTSQNLLKFHFVRKHTQFRRFCSDFFFCSSEVLEEALVWDEIEVSDPQEITFWPQAGGGGLVDAEIEIFSSMSTRLDFRLTLSDWISPEAVWFGDTTRNFCSCCSNAAQTVCWK